MFVLPGSAPAERAARARCWCNNENLAPFAPGYLVCERCSTLVFAAPPEDPTHVWDEANSLYGLSYFNEHAREMGHPVLGERARADLPERCAFWLETLLRFRPPPARTLELGCANGAFVALLSEAGYQATGLDLSPGVTRFARETFQVPVLTGPLEEQHLEPGSVDVLVMMDVLEHLPDPLQTLRGVARLLAPDGLVFVQTPRYDPSKSHAELERTSDPFLAQLKPSEHLLLLSPSSAAALLAEAGFPTLQFVPAIFGHYDMSFLASRVPLREQPEEGWREALRRSRSGRIVEALLDAARSNRREIPALQQHPQEAEGSSAAAREERARLERRIETLAGDLSRLKADLAPLQAELEQLAVLRQHLADAERAQEEQRRLIRDGEEEAARLRAEVADLTGELSRARPVVQAHAELLRRWGFLARILGARLPRP